MKNVSIIKRVDIKIVHQLIYLLKKNNGLYYLKIEYIIHQIKMNSIR